MQVHSEIYQAIKNKVVPHLNPDGVILYGAWVSGQQGNGIPMDFLLYYKNKPQNLKEIKTTLNTLSDGTPYVFRGMLQTEATIERGIRQGNQRLMGILCDGVVIHGGNAFIRKALECEERMKEIMEVGRPEYLRREMDALKQEKVEKLKKMVEGRKAYFEKRGIAMRPLRRRPRSKG